MHREEFLKLPEEVLKHLEEFLKVPEEVLETPEEFLMGCGGGGFGFKGMASAIGKKPAEAGSALYYFFLFS